MTYDKTYREELIEHIKACGQSIIDNAEKIVEIISMMQELILHYM